MSNPITEPGIHRKVIIRPAPNSEEFVWQCPHCQNINLMNKSDISMNHSYSCWSCIYTWSVGYVPDNTRHFLKSVNPESVDIRPRIVVNKRIH